MTWTCRDCGEIIGGYRTEHCAVCHETFTGTAAGDMHRIGGTAKHPEPRRCLTEAEMLDRGMARNKRGVWKSTDEPYNPAGHSDAEDSAAYQPQPDQLPTPTSERP